MLTSLLYDSMSQHLTAQLPEALPSQSETFALAVVGIGQSVSAQIGKIARALPFDTTEAAKEQRLRRLLDNERVTQEEHYQPLAKAALHRKREGQMIEQAEKSCARLPAALATIWQSLSLASELITLPNHNNVGTTKPCD